MIPEKIKSAAEKYAFGKDLPFTREQSFITGAMSEEAREYWQGKEKEVAIAFMDYVTRSESPFAILYGDEKRLCTERGEFTIERIFDLWYNDVYLSKQQTT